MSITILKRFEKTEPNPLFKTSVEISKADELDLFFVSVTNHEKSTKGRKQWKYSCGESMTFSRKELAQFSSFINECIKY